MARRIIRVNKTSRRISFLYFGLSALAIGVGIGLSIFSGFGIPALACLLGGIGGTVSGASVLHGAYEESVEGEPNDQCVNFNGKVTGCSEMLKNELGFGKEEISKEEYDRRKYEAIKNKPISSEQYRANKVR